ncbi:MAG: hypothetical protein M1836_001004 [Candelina mexicana]|nr:MAG: hypothetical protein M1836_001004 [Candelina mexicana]
MSRRNIMNGFSSSEPREDYVTEPPHHSTSTKRRSRLPQYNHNGHKVTKHIHPDGESGRRGIHPWHFFRICFRSSCTASMLVNVLWPFVPAAIAIHFSRPDLRLWIFIVNYIAMIPAANLLGFAGQELARKLPSVFGVVLETTLGSLVEIVLFMVLLKTDHHSGHNIPIIKAAILGSILANLLLCLGMCFFVGGLTRHEQEFDEAISEVGHGLLLVAGLGLIIPSAFATALAGPSTDTVQMTAQSLHQAVLKISRLTAVILLAAFLIYLWFQMRSHHGIYDAIIKADEEKDEDRHKDLSKSKLTLTESIIAIIIALTCVILIAVFLVEQIEFIVEEHHVKDAFMGLILVPLVEKVAEHLTAIDEAWDNTMNIALSHILGATVQTALLNAPLAVIVGWCIHVDLGLNFEIFQIVVVILAIIVVGNFLRDGKSNYLEGALCVLVYLIITVSTWYYPNPAFPGNENVSESGANSTETGGQGQAAHRMLKMMH